jgi:hypothetical protein
VKKKFIWVVLGLGLGLGLGLSLSWQIDEPYFHRQNMYLPKFFFPWVS